MLTLLRKIRKGLLVTGATRKYLLYAMGEIALVVIGILIALQINNWNELRKEGKLEKVYIHRIIEDLRRNVSYLENYSGILLKTIEHCSKADSILALSSFKSLDFGLALNHIFSATRGNENRVISNTYDDLNNSGNFSLIHNLQARKSLNDYYQGWSLGNREYFSLHYLEPYKYLVRQLIPYKLQFKIRACDSSKYEKGLCHLEEQEGLLETIFLKIYYHPDIRGYLNLLTQSRMQDFANSEKRLVQSRNLIMYLQKQYDFDQQ